MTKIFVSSMLLLVSTFLSAQSPELNCYMPDPDATIRSHNVDFKKLDLDIKFTPEDGKLEGVAVYLFNAIQVKVDSVFLDGPGITIQNITLNKQATRFKTDSAGTTVFFNPPLVRNQDYILQIQYDATPKRGIYFVGWNNSKTDDPNDPTIIRKQIWTQGQGVDNRYWIPSYDGLNDKLITSLNITFDKNYTVVSNGALKNATENSNGTKTWKYEMPHPHALYLIMLAIGKYEYLDYTSKNGMISRQYYYPGTKHYAEHTYQYSAEMMDFLVDETNTTYPWTTYANVPVQEFLYGAMENTTATIFSDFFYQDERAFPDKNYVDINAHELTHQWFGDYITAWSGSSHWLQESFATYYAKKFRQKISGDDYYHWKRREEMNTAFDADSKNNLPVGHSGAGSPRVYQKGSIVIDMLRYVVGDEQFKIAIHDFLARYPYDNVESNDFEMQFMRSLGINVEWFFDEWIYRGGFPVYSVQYQKQTDFTQITIQQQQIQNGTIHLFKMPVHVQVHYLDGSFTDDVIWVENSSTEVNIPNADKKEVAFVLFDPNSMIYAKVNFPKAYTELKYQAFNAPNMMDRYDAIVMMRELGLELKREDLIAIYNKENFFGIKSEIISQLANDDNKSSLALLKTALTDTNPLIRRAVISNIQTLHKSLEKSATALLADNNYTNIEIALTRLSTLTPDKTKKYLEVTANEKGATNNIRITWLEIANRTNNNQYINELVNYSSSGYEFRTRNAAIGALVNLNYCDQAAVANLYNALISSNHRLSTPARNALTKLKATPEYNKLIKDYYNSKIWSDWEQRKIGTIKD
ncbi:MAG: M1 family metallopeptidase [Bacteroidetes bacterium]|nr:M1 family metallopeptidase [Bacteroidota bacterium]